MSKLCVSVAALAVLAVAPTAQVCQAEWCLRVPRADSGAVQPPARCCVPLESQSPRVSACSCAMRARAQRLPVCTRQRDQRRDGALICMLYMHACRRLAPGR